MLEKKRGSPQRNNVMMIHKARHRGRGRGREGFVRDGGFSSPMSE